MENVDDDDDDDDEDDDEDDDDDDGKVRRDVERSPRHRIHDFCFVRIISRTRECFFVYYSDDVLLIHSNYEWKRRRST